MRQCFDTHGWVGFNLGRGVDTALWIEPPPPFPQKGLNLKPTETNPWALELTRTQNSAKNENGIFGISAPRGSREVIICRVFDEKNLNQCSKNVRRFWRQSS